MLKNSSRTLPERQPFGSAARSARSAGHSDAAGVGPRGFNALYAMLEELPPPEADRLKKRFDAWRQAMDRLKSDASPAAEDEPLFASDLEIST